MVSIVTQISYCSVKRSHRQCMNEQMWQRSSTILFTKNQPNYGPTVDVDYTSLEVP